MSPTHTDKPYPVWTNPDSEKGKPSLVRLTPETMCLVVVPAEDLEKTVAVLESGGSVLMQNIPLAAIAQLQGDEGDNDLIVTFKQGEVHTDSVTITLADTAKRDELLDALVCHLGTGWVRERQPMSRLTASMWPIGVAAFFCLMTYFMYDEAQQIAKGQQLHPFGRKLPTILFSVVAHWVEGLIGSTGVLIIGGLAVAGCLLWLVSRVTHPPVRITMKPNAS